MCTLLVYHRYITLVSGDSNNFSSLPPSSFIKGRNTSPFWQRFLFLPNLMKTKYKTVNLYLSYIFLVIFWKVSWVSFHWNLRFQLTWCISYRKYKNKPISNALETLVQNLFLLSEKDFLLRLSWKFYQSYNRDSLGEMSHWSSGWLSFFLFHALEQECMRVSGVENSAAVMELRMCQSDY